MGKETGDGKRYWGSCVFLSYLNDEYDRRSHCLPIIKAAESQKARIITSAFTLTEVFWIREKASLDSETKKKIKDFFDYSFISISDFTRGIAEYARELTWDYENIDHWDAVHLATVINSDLVLFETYDKALLSYDSKFKNQKGQKIKILEPFISSQTEIDY